MPVPADPAERAERWDRLFEHLGESPEAVEEAERGRAELATAAAELDVDAELRCSAFPFVVAGTCDGRSFYLRERHGHWRVEVAADPDCADLWGTSCALGIEIAASGAADLCDADGEPSPVETAVKVAAFQFMLYHFAYGDCRRDSNHGDLGCVRPGGRGAPGEDALY